MNLRLQSTSVNIFTKCYFASCSCLFGLLLILTVAFNAQAQSYTLDNSNATALNKVLLEEYSKGAVLSNPDLSSLNFLKEELKGVNYLALGEASHGTEEFYRVKFQMVRYLVSSLNFRVLAFEIDELVAVELNSYVAGQDIDVKDKLKNYGLYNSQSLLDLLVWMRQYNLDAKVRAEDKLRVIGFDNQAYWGDPFARDSLMAKGLKAWVKDNLPVDQKIMIWSHNTHLVRSNTWDVTNSGINSMGSLLAKEWGEKYYFMAFDTNQGSFNVVEGGLKAYSFKQNKILKNQQNPFFFLSYKNKPLGDSVHYPLTTLFSNWQGEPEPSPAKPGIDFDGLIYIQETTASKMIR